MVKGAATLAALFIFGQIPVVPKLFIEFLLLISLGLCCSESSGQRYLAIDKSGISKQQIKIGDDFHFKQLGNPVLYNAVIIGLGDTVIYIGPKEVPVSVPLSEIDLIYVARKWPKTVSLASSFVGGWFLIAGLAEAIADTGNYSAKGAAIIGISLIAVSQLVRLFKWKKYGSKKNRFRILEKF